MRKGVVERFGFPFIAWVRVTAKVGILAATDRRLNNDRDAEIATAIVEIAQLLAQSDSARS